MRQRTSREVEVGRLLVDVGRALRAFDYEGGQHLSLTVAETMREAEHYFADDDDRDLDRAEYLAKVVAYLVRREAPKFAADPRKWIERQRELGI
jgi:hypothetical protein